MKDKIALTSPRRRVSGAEARSRSKLLASILTRRCRNYFARCDTYEGRTTWAEVLLTSLKMKTMKLPTILTTAAMVAGFVPFGQAVCHDGEIALVKKQSVSTVFQLCKHFCYHILK